MKGIVKIKKAQGIYEKIAFALSTILVLMILGAIGLQVITRTFFDMPLKFPEELSIFSLIALIYCGVGITETNEEYLRVEVFQTMMPKKVRNFLWILSKILMLVLIFGILQGEFAIFPSISLLRTTAAKIPYTWLHGWIIVFSFIWATLVIIDIFIDIDRIKETGLAERAHAEEEQA